MPFILNQPDYAVAILAVRADAVVLSDRTLTASFHLSPTAVREDWPVRDAAALVPADLNDLLADAPEVILLGTGSRQVFPPTAVLAACLTRGIGIEVMDNHAAARTFAILASEGRRVVAAFLLPG
ncbi:MAG: hypothetical protein JSS41_00140 [Proteobacteria bacterium]|nr:hypothetical protein [Pseudomonadota bacterium]